MNKKIIVYAIVAIICVGGAFFIATHEPTTITGDATLPTDTENASPLKDIRLDQETDFYSIKAVYPNESLDSAGVMRAFVTSIVDQRKEEWKTGGEIYNEMKELANRFPERADRKYTLYVEYTRVISETQKTITYVFSAYEDTGGAHGNTSLTTFTFDAETPAVPITIESLLDLDAHKDIALTRLLSQKLIRDLADSSSVDMIREGLGLAYLKADGITLDTKKCNCDGFYFPSNMQRFVVNDTGITFIFGQYQVAPYYVGMPEVSLTWKELEPYLQQSAKERFMRE
jgi:hypothetical protein